LNGSRAVFRNVLWAGNNHAARWLVQAVVITQPSWAGVRRPVFERHRSHEQLPGERHDRPFAGAGVGFLFLHPGEEVGWFHGLRWRRLGAVEHAHDDDGGGVNVEGQFDLLAGG
jgi:hypothetical protein